MHPKPKKPYMREGFKDLAGYSPFRPGRLGETSGSTVASESVANRTTAPPPPAEGTGPAGARPQ